MEKKNDNHVNINCFEKKKRCTCLDVPINLHGLMFYHEYELLQHFTQVLSNKIKLQADKVLKLNEF